MDEAYLQRLWHQIVALAPVLCIFALVKATEQMTRCGSSTSIAELLTMQGAKHI